jgi:transcription-repair coupling factor (superfamily II helicase)
MLYRKVASARHDDEIDSILEEAADRYGSLPTSVMNLADYGRIRVMADQLGVESLDREGRTVVIKFGPKAKVDPTRMVMMVRQRPDLTILPPSGLKLSLDGQGSSQTKSGTAAVPSSGARSGRTDAPVAAPAREPLHGRVQPRASGSRSRRPEIAPSWWTARALEGEVRPGFTKAEILRAKPDDPRAPGGVFERVGGLLSEMLG